MEWQNEQPSWLLRRRVLPQHTDHGGVMWHGAYLALLEEARVEALAAAGLPYATLSARGLELPVLTLQVDYRQAVGHGELVELRSQVQPRRGLRLPWISRFMLSGELLAAEARVELALVRRQGGGLQLVRRYPPELELALQRLIDGPGKSC
ncbi:acyl-CoA thioesterase [Synechococcus sp. Cruz-9H2]|uniref:acyl-CoA thioesterase n=1 Tax=unclassified Synechococcus TaxID=2626047 RepID=UPI0020CC295C|nr:MULTISPECIES: acyl-CoA thioesterase [unclassified Synechococcus]MCP9820941.1 acyl-CoA thioesterase [Synechococcus sp. Cruz-9H2]MCP9845176.1 acyl-CoA thioesterase [Synechococcus sp. Edmonson 11F2]MCP9857341.1 acyl-CoA thioesterase [Synechococcus sp. Cruz-9C9]MCP9864586.1 acyl-CoA thioesterase [Synechococcus sp. Cruz-7E5]MCP9871856.1 acyl-CoA thioesterase [Synechococcus sp. Cruz-7B9]